MGGRSQCWGIFFLQSSLHPLQPGLRVFQEELDQFESMRDYVSAAHDWNVESALRGLDALATEELLDLRTVADQLRSPNGPIDLDDALQARGYRLLARVRGLTEAMTHQVVSHFGNLQKILRATPEVLANASGLDIARARAVKDSLARLAETSILDRYS